jgi:hypothetical protein
MANELPDLSTYSHVVPSFELPKFLQLKSQLEAIAEGNLAAEFHLRITEMIKQFDAALDATHEVGIRLVSFGQAVVFHFRQLGYWNPSLLMFFGVMDDGSEVQLIQHVSQISVLLQRLPLQDPTKPKPPIGFRSVNV